MIIAVHVLFYHFRYDSMVPHLRYGMLADKINYDRSGEAIRVVQMELYLLSTHARKIDWKKQN